MKKRFTEAELKAAYETCRLLRAHSNNVLASLDPSEDGTADREWSRQATKFIDAYERVRAQKLAKQGKAGHLGDALNILESMSKNITMIKL